MIHTTNNQQIHISLLDTREARAMLVDIVQVTKAVSVAWQVCFGDCHTSFLGDVRIK